MAANLSRELAEFKLFLVEAEDLCLLTVRVSDISAVKGHLIDTMVATFFNSQHFFARHSRVYLQMLIICIFKKNEVVCVDDRCLLGEGWHMSQLCTLLLLLRVLAVLVSQSTVINQFIDAYVSVDATRNHLVLIKLDQTLNIIRLTSE